MYSAKNKQKKCFTVGVLHAYKTLFSSYSVITDRPG